MKTNLVWVSIAVVMLSVPLPAQEPVSYQLACAAPGEKTVRIRITLPGDPAGPLTLVMPRAVPMGYSQQMYDRYVAGVRALAPDG